MACKYIYKGTTYTKEEFESFVKEEFVKKSPENQFLSLLEKDSNWVTFFIKSIIADSAKLGYEKVLFPTGNTASKVEGHTTLEEFKKQKEDRIKELEKSKSKETYNFTDDYGQTYTVKTNLENINIEINQLKKELERVEIEGFGALRPIYNFYENTVANILKKQGYNPVLITDEYGNTWNEITIPENNPVLLQYKQEFNYTKNKILSKLVEDLSTRFNVKANIITAEKAKEIYPDYTNQAGFYYNGEAYIVEEYADETTAIEEIFTHPFLLMLESSDIETFNSLLEEAKKDQELVDRVERLYPGRSQRVKNHEIIAAAVNKAYSNKNMHKSLLDKVLDFIYRLKKYISDLFGIGRAFTIGDMVNMVQNKKQDLSKPKESTFFFSETETSDNPELKQFIENVRVQIQERIDVLNKTVTNKDKNITYETALAKLTKLEKILSSLPNVEAYIKYAEEANSTLAKAFNSIDSMLGENPDILNLVRIYELAHHYDDILENAIDLVNIVDGETGPMNIREIISNAIILRDGIKRRFLKEAKPIMANVLKMNVNPEATNEIRKEYERLSKKYSDPNLTKLQKMSIKASLDKLSVFLGTDSFNVEKLLESGNVDIGVLEYLFVPLSQSSDLTLSQFSVYVKDSLERARQTSLNKLNETAAKFNELIGRQFNAANAHENIYEEITKTTVTKKEDGKYDIKEEKELHITQEENLDEYYKEKAKAYRAFNEDGDFIHLRLFYSKWHTHLPLEEIREIIEFKKLLVSEGHITEEDFAEYLNENMMTDSYSEWEAGSLTTSEFISNNIDKLYSNLNYAKGELTRPVKTKSTTYPKLTGNKKLYWEHLLSIQEEANSILPHYLKLGTNVPYNRKSAQDRLIEGQGTSIFTDAFKTSFLSVPDDIQTIGVQEGATNRSRLIPVGYVQKLPIEDVSRDITASILRYYQEAITYRSLSKMKPVADTLTALVDSRTPSKLDSSGKKILNKLANKIGITRYLKDHNNNFAKAQLAAFIDNVFFKENRKKEMIGPVRLDKLVDSIMRFAAYTQLGGFNPLLNVTNWANSAIQLSIETASGRYISPSAARRAKLLTSKYMATDLWSDFAKSVPESWIGKLVYKYDIPQGEFTDKLGRSVTGPLAKKLMTSDIWFAGQNASEFGFQLEAALGVLATEQLDGKSVLDYYKEGSEVPVELESRLRNKIHSISKELYGIYNSFDRPAIQQYSLGRLLMMYRKFIVPGVQRRFKGLSYNNEKQDFTEGYFNTFMRLLIEDMRSVMSLLIPGAEHNFSPREIQNLRKAAVELAFIGSLAILGYILSGLEWDDEDANLAQGYALYLTLRLQREIAFYVNPSSTLEIISSPTVAYSIVKRFFKLASIIANPTKWGDTYEKDEGIWQKGDSKLMSRFLQLFGINGYSADPAYAISLMRRVGI